MTSDRIEEIQKKTAYPESNSGLEALKQVWNEMQQEFNSRLCVNCISYGGGDELGGGIKLARFCRLGIRDDSLSNISNAPTFGCTEFSRSIHE